MIRTHSTRSLALLAVFCFLRNVYPNPVADSADTSAAQLLPETVALYAEMPSPVALFNLILKHPLREQVQAMPVYQAAWQSKNLVQLRGAISLFEAGMGKRLPAIVEELSAGGLVVAVDAQTEGVVAIIQARDAEIIEQLRDIAFSAIRGNKLAGADGDPIREGQYRGVTGYAIRDNLRAAALGNTLVITNKAELGKSIIDRFLGDKKNSLFEKANFADALAKRASEYTAWGYVDVEMIRESGQAKELYSGKTDNFIAELLFGGIMSNLKATPHATATLAASGAGVDLQLTTPHDSNWVGEDRAYYFGSEGDARAPQLLNLENQVFALSTYRNMSEAWLRAGDLMTDKANDQLAQADTQLTTFFSGRDFGEDILGALEPEIQLVAVQQDFEDILPRPAIKLPAFALRFTMRDPEETQPELRRVFQSFIGFLNVVGAMNGQPQFDLEMETKEATQMVSATYVANRDDRSSTDAAINFNFSPTIAFSGKQLIISSTTQLANVLLNQTPASKREGENTVAELKAPILFQILDDNRGQLVAQNMLEKGHSKDAAEGEIGVLLELIKLFDKAHVQLAAAPGQLSLNLSVELAQEN